MMCETIEPTYAAWMDGQAAWLVGAWPGNTQLPSRDPRTQKWTLTGANGRASLDARAQPYLVADRWSGLKDRQFGPSSNHEGAVVHGYVDCHIVPLSNEIDPAVYLSLISVAGGETIDHNSVPVKDWQEPTASSTDADANTIRGDRAGWNRRPR